MLLHAREGHVEVLGKGRDRSVRTPELLQNAASRGVRERAERGIEVGLAILNHTVQYTTWVTALQRSHMSGVGGGQAAEDQVSSRPFPMASRCPARLVSKSTLNGS